MAYLLALDQGTTSSRAIIFDSQGDPAIGTFETDPADEILRPQKTGSYTQCYRYGDSNNYKCVDEATPDDSSTYIYSKYGDTRMDTYEVNKHSEGTGYINSVTVHARARASYSGDCDDMRMQIITRTNYSNYYGSEITLTGNAGWDE